jgi:protocatechuate 3,4-dioxygenase beta subunit
MMKHFAILFIVLLNTVCSGQSQKLTASDATWKIIVAAKDEPGERLVVSGTVYAADGKTPLAGVSVYVYHTDIKGYYSGETTNNSNPRLHGTMLTDARGRYEFETIKPGPYPAARVPAHIHYVVKASGYKEKIFEIVFEGDTLINEQIREDARSEDSIFSIRPLEKQKDGLLKCVQDIVLRKQ